MPNPARASACGRRHGNAPPKCWWATAPWKNSIAVKRAIWKPIWKRSTRPRPSRKNLRKAGFDAETYIVYTLRDIDRLIEKYDPDNLLFFNLCEHLQGRATDDVKITMRLDKLGITYTGAPTATLRRTLDKGRAKQVLQKQNIPTAPYQVFARADEADQRAAARHREAGGRGCQHGHHARVGGVR